MDSCVIFDDLFIEPDLAAARAAWPASDWPGWIAYDPKTQCKRASSVADVVPSACAVLLAQMAALRVADWFPDLPLSLCPDLSLWGAGLHEMPAGPGLGRHLDADTHGRLGLRRVLSASLYVHDRWEQEWGGDLVFDAGVRVSPAPGRLVVFDARSAWHRVAAVNCPAQVHRLSLAMFWYEADLGPGTRLRAQFAA